MARQASIKNLKNARKAKNDEFVESQLSVETRQVL